VVPLPASPAAVSVGFGGQSASLVGSGGPSAPGPISSAVLGPEAKHPAPELKAPALPISALRQGLDDFWHNHTVQEVWECRVPALTRVPKKVIGPLSHAFLSVLGSRLHNWASDEAHAAEVLFFKCVLRTMPPAKKGPRPIDVLRRRLNDWNEGKLEQLWAAATRAPR
jgi:hypothetical protein